jgi:hypothetical protein
MPHPDGGQGNTFAVTHTFQDAFAAVAGVGAQFNSTTGYRETLSDQRWCH